MPISTLKHKITELHAGTLAMVPIHYAETFEEMIPTINCFKHASAVGEINTYYLETGEFMLSYSKFLMKRNVTLAMNSREQLVELRIPYLNQFCQPRNTVFGMNLFYAPQKDLVLRIPANRPCSSFNIAVRRETLEELSKIFPGLDKFRVKIETGKTGRMFSTDLPVPVEILAQIQQILHSTSAIPVRRSLLPNQLFQIFVMGLEKLSLGSPYIELKQLTNAELKRLRALKDYVASENNLLPPMRQLASQFYLRPETAEHGFRKLYGLSIARFHQLLRLGRVRVALEHTEIDKYELSDHLGFESYGSFVNHFAGRFGCSPGYLQRQYQPNSILRQ